MEPKRRSAPRCQKTENGSLSVAIAGLGTIGRAVATALDRGICGLHLVAVSSGDMDKAHAFLAGLGTRGPNSCPLRSLGSLPTSLSSARLRLFCARSPSRRWGHGRKVFIVRPEQTTRRLAPYLTEKGLSIDDISEPVKIFEGTARQAALGFPANLNIGTALGLAGLGPDQTIIEVWADPGIDRNTRHIEVEADSSRFRSRSPMSHRRRIPVPAGSRRSV